MADVKRLTVAALIIGALLGGCSRPAPEAASRSEDEVAQGSPAPERNSTTPFTPPGEKPPPTKPTPETSPPQTVPKSAIPKQVVDPARMTIRQAGTDGWTVAAMNPRALAERIDRSLANLRGAEGQATFFQDSPRGNGSSTGQIRIADRNRFFIEYSLVRTEVDLNQIVADGNAKALYEARKWQARRPLNQALLAPSSPDRFLTEFPRDMFASLVDGVGGWQRAVAAWTRAGYQVLVETKTMDVRGTKTPFYRLMVNRSGKAPANFEARFDGMRNLPVTVRLNARDQAGKETRLQWSAAWRFNQTIDPKVFKVPMSLAAR